MARTRVKVITSTGLVEETIDPFLFKANSPLAFSFLGLCLSPPRLLFEPRLLFDAPLMLPFAPFAVLQFARDDHLDCNLPELLLELFPLLVVPRETLRSGGCVGQDYKAQLVRHRCHHGGALA